MRTYARLLRGLGPYRLRLAVALACMGVYAAMNFLSLGMIAPFMTVLFERGGTGPGPLTPHAAGAGLPEGARRLLERMLLDAPALVALERLCLLFLGVFLIKNAADYLQAYLMVSVEQGAIRDLRSRLHAHLQTLSLSYFHGRRTGALMSRVTNDMEYLRASIASGLGNLIKDGLTLMGALVWVFHTSWRLALLSLVIAPPVGFALARIGRSMRRRSGQAQERMGEITGTLQETLAGVRVVRAFGMEGFEQRKFDRANDGFYRAFTRMRRVSAAARPVTELAIVSVAVAMLWLGGRAAAETRRMRVNAR